MCGRIGCGVHGFSLFFASACSAAFSLVVNPSRLSISSSDSAWKKLIDQRLVPRRHCPEGTAPGIGEDNALGTPIIRIALPRHQSVLHQPVDQTSQIGVRDK